MFVKHRGRCFDLLGRKDQHLNEGGIGVRKNEIKVCLGLFDFAISFLFSGETVLARMREANVRLRRI